jgi:hypothetical protein
MRANMPVLNAILFTTAPNDLVARYKLDKKSEIRKRKWAFNPKLMCQEARREKGAPPLPPHVLKYDHIHACPPRYIQTEHGRDEPLLQTSISSERRAL